MIIKALSNSTVKETIQHHIALTNMVNEEIEGVTRDYQDLFSQPRLNTSCLHDKTNTAPVVQEHQVPLRVCESDE